MTCYICDLVDKVRNGVATQLEKETYELYKEEWEKHAKNTMSKSNTIRTA